MSTGKREARKRARRRQQRLRLVAFGVVAGTVLIAAGYLLEGAFSRPDLEPMAGKVVDVAADMAGFDKSEIRLKAGEPVSIRLTSLDNEHHTDGGGKHQWAVDELGIDIVAQPLSSAYATFTPQEAGQYTFYCDVCCGGRANPSMQGTLIVEA